MLLLRFQTLALVRNQYPRPLVCPWCGQPRFFNIVLVYSWCSLFHVFGLVYEQNQTLRCSICQREPDMVPLDVDAQATGPSIPLLRRYGLLLALGVPLLIGIISLIAP